MTLEQSKRLHELLLDTFEDTQETDALTFDLLSAIVSAKYRHEDQQAQGRLISLCLAGSNGQPLNSGRSLQRDWRRHYEHTKLG
jgi:hypothetical protein